MSSVNATPQPSIRVRARSRRIAIEQAREVYPTWDPVAHGSLLRAVRTVGLVATSRAIRSATARGIVTGPDAIQSAWACYFEWQAIHGPHAYVNVANNKLASVIVNAVRRAIRSDVKETHTATDHAAATAIADWEAWAGSPTHKANAASWRAHHVNVGGQPSIADRMERLPDDLRESAARSILAIATTSGALDPVHDRDRVLARLRGGRIRSQVRAIVQDAERIA